MFPSSKRFAAHFQSLTATDITIQMPKRLILKTLKYSLESLSQLQAFGWWGRLPRRSSWSLPPWPPAEQSACHQPPSWHAFFSQSRNFGPPWASLAALASPRRPPCFSWSPGRRPPPTSPASPCTPASTRPAKGWRWSRRSRGKRRRRRWEGRCCPPKRRTPLLPGCSWSTGSRDEIFSRSGTASFFDQVPPSFLQDCDRPQSIDSCHGDAPSAYLPEGRVKIKNLKKKCKRRYSEMSELNNVVGHSLTANGWKSQCYYN